MEDQSISKFRLLNFKLHRLHRKQPLILFLQPVCFLAIQILQQSQRLNNRTEIFTWKIRQELEMLGRKSDGKRPKSKKK